MPVSPISVRQLRTAQREVLARRRAQGDDGQDPEHLRASPTMRNRLVRYAHRHLEIGDYRFHPARVGVVERPGRRRRQHAILTMNDATVMRAITNAMVPAWQTLPDSIRGGRPGAPGASIIGEVTRALPSAGAVLRFDISTAYAATAFKIAVGELASRTDRQDLLPLIERFRADQPADDFPGLVEGSALAPLMLAVTLADAMIAAETFGPTFVWYDDGLILTPDLDAAERAREVIERELGRVGLTLHPMKTVVRPVDLSDLEPDWHFLGFRWAMGLPEPIPQAGDELVERIGRYLEQDEPGLADQAIRGWAGYFGISPNTAYFATLDARIRREYGEDAVSLPKLTNLAIKMIALPEAEWSPRSASWWRPMTGGVDDGIF